MTTLLYDADSLFSIGDTTNTLLKLQEYVESDRHSEALYYSKSLKSELFNHVNGRLIKADICITLSHLYNHLNQPENALKYLDLADNAYFPRYGGCLNGMIMYKTKLSIHYANHYLSIGERRKAIECLLEYFLSNEAYERKAARDLKKILLTQFSQDEIKREVVKGLEEMFIDKTAGSNNEELVITFFGKTIRKYSFGTLESSKSLYEKHYCILILKNNENEVFDALFEKVVKLFVSI